MAEHGQAQLLGHADVGEGVGDLEGWGLAEGRQAGQLKGQLGGGGQGEGGRVSAEWCAPPPHTHTVLSQQVMLKHPAQVRMRVRVRVR